MVKTLYVTYDKWAEDFDIGTKEPKWDKDIKEWVFPRNSEEAFICYEVAKTLFPKIRKDNEEFLTFTVKEGNVWGPAV